ncbi:transglutaminase family protein [Methylovirgula sp. 4M-Z18]|uniref:transglutaminase family protein n=1 Tax=Methylovirgula sp. 4M-Z18 TaxID=2293567 RepID=UPI000E2E6382|nr:transglutaminase family protein [Methylovirgula sp. 4M-Z18]RFB75690.1 transglutaminase family protein [Methylovirgula sp. 4M-Z18]
MIYDIQQTTECEYATPVPVAKHILRMTPVNRVGQDVLDAWLEIDPTPTEMRAFTDFFGNRVTHVEIDKPHEAFVISTLSRVQVEPAPPLDADTTLPFEKIRDMASASDSLDPSSPVHFLFPSYLLPLDDDIAAYAEESFPAGRPILAGALDLMQRIKRDFTYEPGVTDVSTPPAEAFHLKRGVCQDFAHVMIVGLRSLGLPAAYVSGYLRTVPPPGQKRLEGADATHAWVSVWCGPEDGWRGLDPTNAIAASEDHIILAIGRDYADVAPSEGMIISSGGQKLKVGVDVIPIRS